jgi:L-alanine-DL-glutamate epimerase-like enolase superfamily enzyme
MIASIETSLYRFPPHRRILDAIQEFERMEVITATVTADDGSTGFGFTYTIGRGGNSVRVFLDEELVPLYLGREETRPEGLWEEAWWKLHWVGRQGIWSLSVAALDIALYDLNAKRAELPLYRYLGACRSEIPAYNTDGGWLNHGLDELVREATELVEERGFRAFKMKVGKEERAEDERRVRAVRKAIGQDAKLMADANMKWSAAEAIARAQRFEPYDLFWLEEPIEADDVAGHRRLSERTSIPVAVGESLYNRHAFAAYLDQKAAAILQPDVGRCAGITEWLRIAKASHTLNLQVSPHFLMELHVHLACSIPNALFVEHIPFLDRFVRQPLVPQGGMFRPPEEPGHGIAFVEDRVARHRVATQRFDHV